MVDVFLRSDLRIYFRLLNLQVENAKLKVEDDSGAFSSLASESPKPTLDISLDGVDHQMRVESIQVIPEPASNTETPSLMQIGTGPALETGNICLKCLTSLGGVTPWALISEALNLMKGTMKVEVIRI